MTQPQAADLSHAPFKGITLVLAAVALFAAMDTVGKILMTKYNVPLVAFIRYGLNLVLLAGLMMPRHGTGLWHTNRTALVLLRGASLAVATLLAGLALQRLPVGEMVSIIYLQGFGVMLAARLALGERVSLVGWLCAAAGFAGVVLIARPGGALAPLGVMFALLAAIVSVLYILLSRVLATSETTMAMLFHVAVAGVVVFGLMQPFTWAAPWQSPAFARSDFALFAFMGIASLLGHYLLTSAYRHAPASLLAPFNYFHIAFAVFAGWLVYDHVPDAIAIGGMALIAVAGAAVAIHTHMTSEAAAQA
jgi:drug/metabolite transporter (DMT)-like permease